MNFLNIFKYKHRNDLILSFRYESDDDGNGDARHARYARYAWNASSHDESYDDGNAWYESNDELNGYVNMQKQKKIYHLFISGMHGMMNPMMMGMMNPMGMNRVIIHHHIGDDGDDGDAEGDDESSEEEDRHHHHSSSAPSGLKGVGQFIGEVAGKDYYRLPSVRPPNMSPFVWNNLISYSTAPQNVKIIPSRDLTNWQPARSTSNGQINPFAAQNSQARLQRNDLMNKNMQKENQLMVPLPFFLYYCFLFTSIYKYNRIKTCNWYKK